MYLLLNDKLSFPNKTEFTSWQNKNKMQRERLKDWKIALSICNRLEILLTGWTGVLLSQCFKAPCTVILVELMLIMWIIQPNLIIIFATVRGFKSIQVWQLFYYGHLAILLCQTVSWTNITRDFYFILSSYLTPFKLWKKWYSSEKVHLTMDRFATLDRKEY